MSSAPTSLGALLERVPRTTFVVGKGGVGKTTLSVELATAFARRGARTLVLSTDPAAALGALLGVTPSDQPTPVASEVGLDALQLSAPRFRAVFLARWREVLVEIVDRGTYLERGEIDGLVEAALPGADEVFGLLAVADLLADAASPYARIIIDTAPTGHTLRLLALPDTFRALLAMLDTMQEKHRFMVRALTHRYRRDRADAFLADMDARITRLHTALRDPSSVAAILVTREGAMVEAETTRYLRALGELGIAVAAVVDIATIDPSEWPRDEIAPARSKPEQSGMRVMRSHKAPIAPDARVSSILRPLTIVAGKGGVGKTTVACALALASVDGDGASTLLVSTDPAASIADALGEADAEWARGDVEHALEAAPGLVVRQMDAGAAFARLRDSHQSRIDALFESITGHGLNVAHDRAVLRDLLALAPPGIDELFALSALAEALDDGRFTRVVVDPAPTGHLLRLLDMPAIALDWSHRLMRLMLRYRDVVTLGDAAAEVLAFAKRARAVEALLHDAARATVLIVALDEPMVRDETVRLREAIVERGIDVGAIVWNQVDAVPAPLPESHIVRQLCAQRASPPPIGAPALRAWSKSWTMPSADH